MPLSRAPASFSQLRRLAACASGRTSAEKTAAEMIRYALVDSRRRSEGWHEEAMRVLEMGAASLATEVEASGMVSLAMATILYETGKLSDAVEKLNEVYRSTMPLEFRVAAWEGLMGIKLESTEDSACLVSPEDMLNISTGSSEENVEHLKFRASAVEGLSCILDGRIESAKSCFEGFENLGIEASKDQIGSSVLSYGEYLHCIEEFSLAERAYAQVIKSRYGSERYVSAANMVPAEAYLGATCSLGQLFSHLGKADEAEGMLTEALTLAERHFGKNHPKVGVVLTSIGRMFKQKARSEGSSSMIVQEGLYRKALELLKAPPLDFKDLDRSMNCRDIISLARGEYAELLCIQSNRKQEGERMMKWAEESWRNRRLSLSDALGSSESPTLAVVDTRICRVL